MANIGQSNAHEALESFRDLTEAFSEVGLVYQLGRASLEPYFAALGGMLELYRGDQTWRQSALKDLSEPDCITVERFATGQKVSICAAVLGGTAITASSLAVGLEYERIREGDSDGFKPSRLSTRVSSIGPTSSYIVGSSWWPPFGLYNDDTDIDAQAAVQAKYDRGFATVLGVVRQFNNILTPVINEVQPGHPGEG